MFASRQRGVPSTLLHFYPKSFFRIHLTDVNVADERKVFAGKKKTGKLCLLVGGVFLICFFWGGSMEGRHSDTLA